MTDFPELIGEYEEWMPPPDPRIRAWKCLACDADCRKKGLSGTEARITDRAHHTRWHEMKLRGRGT